MKATATLLAAAIGLASATAAFADVSKKDQAFLTKAATGGLFEVQAGQLAEQKGQSDSIQSFGAMLVKDHGVANDELKELAARKGATLPTSLPQDKQKKLEKISRAKNFDKEFVKEVGVHDHKTDIALFEKASTGADDPDVNAFATKTLPTLKAHKDHADGLKKLNSY